MKDRLMSLFDKVENAGTARPEEKLVSSLSRLVTHHYDTWINRSHHSSGLLELCDDIKKK